MSVIHRQGLNWVIIDKIGNLDFINSVVNDVDTANDWSSMTSAKGIKSRQHYILNPKWKPVDNLKQPEGWEELRRRYTNIVQKEIVNYGLMPFEWKDLYPTSAWTVIGEEGSYHTVHEHGVGNISTVLYLKVPKDQPPPAGQIFFVMHSDPYSDLSNPQFRTLHIHPEEGMIVIFPSWMIHGVYPQGPGVRQTLNIDFNGDPDWRTKGLNLNELS